MLHVKFKMFVDRPGVMRAIDRKRLRVLSRVGAFAMTVMRRMIRAPKSSKRARTIDVNGRSYFVPMRGKVLDARTRRPVTRAEAESARRAMALRLRSEGEGQPPRRGPTDLLRRNIFFGVDTDTESVVIGPRMFAKQPPLVGAVSVPELLEKGGIEIIMGKRAKYGARPYAAPTLPIAERKFRELIESEPLK